jgi:ubiquinone/menaquinone biosynthesis C-methylase UbiE
MPTEKEVYQFHADWYERLILAEDYQGNIDREITAVQDPQGLDIVELGAGTGRLTRSLFKKAGSVIASDGSLPMLLKGKEILANLYSTIPLITTADMRRIPLDALCADMVIAGWSFCYLAVWGGENWQVEVDQGIKEAMRLLKPGGLLILLESFGTGAEQPEPPSHLVNYLDYLTKKGFESRWFRTDYRFPSVDEADEVSSFFFGPEMSEKIRRNQWTLLPECTAIYWCRKTELN